MPYREDPRTGDIRTIFLTINMIPGSKRYVASLIDITELKKMEDVLKHPSKDSSSGPPGTG